MATITDDEMRAMLQTVGTYTLVLLYATGVEVPDQQQLIWEHGRRNFSLRADGVLAVVCPMSDDTRLAGMGIFTAGVDEVRRIMDEDPAVMAGIFTYETHPCRGFPGDGLPA